MEYTVFLKRLKEMRKSKGISMREMGEILGLTKGQIWNIENGVTALRVQDYLKICEILDVSPSALLLESSQTDTEQILQSLPLLSQRDCRIVKDLIAFMSESCEKL